MLSFPFIAIYGAYVSVTGEAVLPGIIMMALGGLTTYRIYFNANKANG